MSWYAGNVDLRFSTTADFAAIRLVIMAATREQLTDTLGKLRLAFSDLRPIDEEVVALTACVGGPPLLEAAARVSQGAKAAATVASRVLNAAEAAHAVAVKATSVATAARGTRTGAENVVVAATQAIHTETVVAEAEPHLEVKTEPCVLLNHKCEESVFSKFSYDDD